MAIRKVVRDTNLGTYFDVGVIEPNKINPVLPAVNLIALGIVPTTTGNAANRNEFVTDIQGNQWFIDYAGDGFKLNKPYFFNSLATAFPAVAQTNTTRVTVTGWTFPVTAGKSYKIQVLATFTTAAGGTGGSMGLITSAGAVGNIHGYFDADITNTTVATGLKSVIHTVNTVSTTAGSFMTSTGTTVGQPASFTCNAIFNCTTGGSLNVQWGTEVANSLAAIRLGSSLIVEVLN